MYIELVNRLDSRKKKIWQDLLTSVGLKAGDDAEQTVLLWDGEKLVASGSRDGSVLKYIAVAPEYQGEDLTARVLVELRKEAFSQGIDHLFVFTKPQNEKMFGSLFFYTVAKTEKVLLMENSKDGITKFLENLPLFKTDGKFGAIVMNANPFTLGHRYLVETAAKECDFLYLFVVSEDESEFSAKDRLEMVKLGTNDIPNVAVLPTGPYLVSRATFPTYFLQDRDNQDQVQCSLDIEIFKNYFSPWFKITKRFVGSEPLSLMTNQYNLALKEGLNKSGIEVVEIERLEINGAPVSASRVREMISKKQLKEIKQLVPTTTFEYLKNKGIIG